ncbi:MAG: extracellular solute-binding protein [Armatimonadota bacterium]
MRRLCAALALMLLLAGCARVPLQPDQSAATPQTITFAFWALEPAEVALTHQLARQFEQFHPGVQVSVMEIPGRYYDKLSTMFAAGTPPDVMVVNYGRLGDLARRGLLADLQPLLPPGLSLSEFLPQAAEAFAGIGPKMGRPGLFALPVDWSPTNLLLYDPDALAASGVASPRGSWSWQQFEDACRKLSSVMTGNRRPASLCLYPYAAASWLLQGGGTLLAPDGKRSTLGAAENVRTVEFLRRLQHEKLALSPDPAQDRSLEDFQTGRAAFAFVTPYTLTSLRKHPRGRRWGLALPLRDRRQVTGCIPSGVAVAARSPHLQTAAQFAAFYATEGARARAAAGWSVSAHLTALQSPALDAAFGKAPAGVLRQAAARAVPHPLSPLLPYEQTSQALRHALEQVFSGQRGPVQALGEAAANLNREAERLEQQPNR